MHDKSILEKLLDAQKVINEAVSSLTSTQNGHNQQKNGHPGDVYECPQTPEGHDPNVFQNAYMDLVIAKKSLEESKQQRGMMAEPHRKEEPPMPTCPKLLRGCLSLRKDGRWMVRYRMNDGHQRTIYERSRYDAIVKANERIRYDLKNPETAVVLGRLVLDAWFDKWLKKQAQSLKESTIVNYQRKYDCHIRGTALGKKQCAKILPSDVEAGLLRISKNSVRVILWIVLKMAFSDLLANGAVRTNPAEQLTRKPERIKAREKPVFTWAQMELFLTKLWARDELLARYSRFIAASGMRSGEALGLEWADIDFEKGLISVTKQYDQRLRKITTPKTESSVRVVPLLNGCKEALDGMKKQKGAIFKSLQPHCVSAKFTHEAKMLGMNGLTLHGLRHFFTSQCYQNGVDPAVVKKALGHSNLSTTLDIYTHLDKPFEDAELQKMARNGGYDPLK